MLVGKPLPVHYSLCMFPWNLHQTNGCWATIHNTVSIWCTTTSLGRGLGTCMAVLLSIFSMIKQRAPICESTLWKLQKKIYSGRTLLLCMTFVLIIMTPKHFWLLQGIWHQTRQHKFLVLEKVLLFYRSVVEVELPDFMWPHTRCPKKNYSVAFMLISHPNIHI